MAIFSFLRRAAIGEPTSPEFALLCLCCVADPASEQLQAMRELAATGIDWPAFRQLVDRHRVAGLAFAALKAAQITPDRAVASALALAALQIRRDNHIAAAETVRLQARLDAEGIEARFFKGAAVAQLAYGSLDIKHSKDIDILVAPAQAPRLVALLEADGYRLWLPASRLDAAHWPALLRFGKEVAMVRPGTSLQIEPHWRLASNPRLLARLDASAPAQTITLTGHGDVRTLTREDSFAYLCVHGMEHGWFRLKWLADLHALVAGAAPDEIVALYRHAEGLGVAPSVLVAFALCEALFGLALPAELRTRVRSSPMLRRLERMSLQAMRDPSVEPRWWRYFELNLQVARAQGYLGTQAVLSWIAIEDVVRHPLPRALHFLYPFLRVPLAMIRRMRGAPPPAYPEIAPTEISRTSPSTT